MAEGIIIQIRRGLKSQIDTLAASGGLLEGELLHMTDECRVVVAHDSYTYVGNGGPPVTITASTHIVTGNTIVCNYAGTVTLTFPDVEMHIGKEINIKTITANTVVSASSNVCPLTSATPGTAILAATAGKWASLVSDGTNWIIMGGN